MYPGSIHYMARSRRETREHTRFSQRDRGDHNVVSAESTRPSSQSDGVNGVARRRQPRRDVMDTESGGAGGSKRFARAGSHTVIWRKQMRQADKSSASDIDLKTVKGEAK